MNISKQFIKWLFTYKESYLREKAVAAKLVNIIIDKIENPARQISFEGMCSYLPESPYFHVSQIEYYLPELYNNLGNKIFPFSENSIKNKCSLPLNLRTYWFELSNYGYLMRAAILIYQYDLQDRFTQTEYPEIYETYQKAISRKQTPA